MAYGGWKHNKIQFGLEAVAGTGVAATEIWRGIFSHIEPNTERVRVEENVGLAVTSERSYLAATGGSLALPATELTFEQGLHIMEASVNTDGSPSGSGPWVYTYAPPTDNTVNTLQTYTLEMVNALVSGTYREMSYGFVEEWEISGNAGEAWTISATWRGRQPAAGTATSLSTLLTVEEAVVPRTKIYIDDTTGTVGTTQKTGVFMGGSMRYRSGWQVIPVGDGTLTFSGIKYVGAEIDFTMRLELESDSNVVGTEQTHMDNNTIRLIQWKIDGATPGNEYVQIQMAATWDDISSWENQDGNTVVVFDGHAAYSSSDSLFWTMEWSCDNNIHSV